MIIQSSPVLLNNIYHYYWVFKEYIELYLRKGYTYYVKKFTITNTESPTKMSYVTDNPIIQEQKRHRGNPNWGIAKPYDEVRAYIKPMKFKSFKEYQEWVRDEREAGRGEGFPLNPHMVYARKNEWISREHFLGFTDITTLEIVHASEDSNITHRFSFSKIKSIINQILGIKPETA